MNDQPETIQLFFASRLDGYDDHMLHCVESMDFVYRCLADLLPQGTKTLLDLGCGTGLELQAIFDRFPMLQVTGIDLTQPMLDVLAQKYSDKHITLQCGDYFQTPWNTQQYDAILSVQSLHHFTHTDKRDLYRRVASALNPGGLYIEADYIAHSQAEEQEGFAQRTRLLAHADPKIAHWHIDTPCTLSTQIRLLTEAGMVIQRPAVLYGNTAVIVAGNP